MFRKWINYSRVVTFLVLFTWVYLFTGVIGIAYSSLDFANLYGFLALIFYCLSLFPSNGSIFLSINTIPFQIKKLMFQCITKLRQCRRQVGIASFGFSLAHGILVFYKHSSSWGAEVKAYTMMPHYWHGLTLMVVMTILAITSNNWSVKKMKKSWLVVHRLTYPMAFLVCYHVFAAMKFHWSALTSTGVVLSLSILILLSYRYYSGVLLSSPKIISNYRRSIRNT